MRRALAAALLALPTAQVWPFPVEERWPQTIGDRAMDTYHRWMEVTSYATFAGLPAASVPVGFDDRGLPMGMQLIGRPQADLAVLRIPLGNLPAITLGRSQDLHVGDPLLAIGNQRVDLVMNEQAFRDELADCRTFGFLAEVEALRAVGLARGGSMENAVVIDGDRILNEEGLRRPNEFVRHKALDAVGDLYVLGSPLLARFEGYLAGHALNNDLVRALLANPQAWRYRPAAQALAQVG